MLLSGQGFDATDGTMYFPDNSNQPFWAIPNYNTDTGPTWNTPGGYDTGVSLDQAPPIGTYTGGDVSGGGTNWGGLGDAAGDLASAYGNASTDSTGSVLSGAASGVAAGAAFGPMGMVAGGIIGGVLGLFGSKNKKKQEKKAFEQQMQSAIAPEKQAQANWLQKQGLLQQALSNYAGNSKPYQYHNALLGGNNYNPTMPSNPNQPNFNVAPPDVATGKTNTQGPPAAPQFSNNQGQNSQNISNYQQQYGQYLQNQDQQMAVNAMQPYGSFQGAYHG